MSDGFGSGGYGDTSGGNDGYGGGNSNNGGGGNSNGDGGHYSSNPADRAGGYNQPAGSRTSNSGGGGNDDGGFVSTITTAGRDILAGGAGVVGSVVGDIATAGVNTAERAGNYLGIVNSRGYETRDYSRDMHNAVRSNFNTSAFGATATIADKIGQFFGSIGALVNPASYFAPPRDNLARASLGIDAVTSPRETLRAYFTEPLQIFNPVNTERFPGVRVTPEESGLMFGNKSDFNEKRLFRRGIVAPQTFTANKSSNSGGIFGGVNSFLRNIGSTARETLGVATSVQSLRNVFSGRTETAPSQTVTAGAANDADSKYNRFLENLGREFINILPDRFKRGAVNQAADDAGIILQDRFIPEPVRQNPVAAVAIIAALGALVFAVLKFK